MDHFAALGLPRRFRLDRAELERRYYAASRELHPDRFSTAGASERANSLQKMSEVNQAYQLLRTPEGLRSHILELEGVAAPKAQVPMELAEGWFEVQDRLMDDPEGAQSLLSEFESELAGVKESRQDQLAVFEEKADSEVDPATRRAHLEKIARLAQDLSYIASMERDIDRMKKRLAGS